MLIETDVLLAALNRRDPLRPAALDVLSTEGLVLSPYALLEINLLVRAGKMKVGDFRAFADELGAYLRTRGIPVLPDRAEYHATAHSIERRHRLSFFDSLHAAAAMGEGGEIVSADRAYDRIAGVRRKDPEDM